MGEMFDCAKSPQSYAQFSLKLVDNDIRVPVAEQPPIPLPKQTSSLDRRRATQFQHLQLDTSKSELQKNVATFPSATRRRLKARPRAPEFCFKPLLARSYSLHGNRLVRRWSKGRNEHLGMNEISNASRT